MKKRKARKERKADAEYIGNRMLRMELLGGMKRGERKWRFMKVDKVNMLAVGVT